MENLSDNLNKEKSFTIIVSTSELYREILEVFLFFLKKNFITSLDIIIVSDKLNFNSIQTSNVKIFSTDTDWSSRMKIALSEVKTEYVLFFFEDFIIKNLVNIKNINELFTFIKKNKVDYLKINNSKRKTNNHLTLKNNITVGDIPNYDIYPLPLQVSFWKTEFLLKTLLYKLNPWEYEMRIKNFIDLKKYKIMTIVKNSPINYYDRGLVIKGRLVRSELKFLEQNNYKLKTNMKKEQFLQLFYRTNFFLNFLRYIKYTFLIK